MYQHGTVRRVRILLLAGRILSLLLVVLLLLLLVVVQLFEANGAVAKPLWITKEAAAGLALERGLIKVEGPVRLVVSRHDDVCSI